MVVIRDALEFHADFIFQSFVQKCIGAEFMLISFSSPSSPVVVAWVLTLTHLPRLSQLGSCSPKSKKSSGDRDSGSSKWLEQL